MGFPVEGRVKFPQRTVLAWIIMLQVVFSASGALALVGYVTYRWTEPDEGTEAVKYLVEIRFSENREIPFGDWFQVDEVPGLEAEILMDLEKCYEVRVRAVDAEGVKGPYSLPSVSSCDE